MTPREVALLLKSIKGGYQQFEISEEALQLWSNAMVSTDLNVAQKALAAWTAENQWAPRVADLNGEITKIRRVERGETVLAAERGDEVARRAFTQRGLRCDGSRWVHTDAGLIPCPACNGWQREQWEDGRWHEHYKHAPAGTEIEPPCGAFHAADGNLVVEPKRAMQLMLDGLREQLTEDGVAPEDLEAEVSRRMPKAKAWLTAIGPERPGSSG